MKRKKPGKKINFPVLTSVISDLFHWLVFANDHVYRKNPRPLPSNLDIITLTPTEQP